MALSIGTVMQQDLVTVDPDMTLAELDRRLLEAGVSGAPVVSEGRLVGIVSRTDVIRTLGDIQQRVEAQADFYRDPLLIGVPLEAALTRPAELVAERLTKTRVAQVMSRSLITVGADDDVREAAKVMAATGVHRLLVVDPGDHRLLGLVSTLDLVRLIWDFGLASR
jgi:CBS domain-containing protein